jgi:hypothetical protein
VRFPIVALTVPIAFLAGSLAAADEVRLRSGESLSGEWKLERVVLATELGTVVVPIFNILSIHSDEGRSSITLRDGTALEGVLELEAVELEMGLVSRRISFPEIAEIRLETSSEEVALRTHEAGGYIQVDDLPAGGQTVSVPCPMRLRMQLPSRFKAGTWTSPATRIVECDGTISIPVVEFQFRQDRKGSGRLVVKPSIRVKPPQDKLVALSLALEVNGSQVGSIRREAIDAEEGGMTWKRFSFELPPEVVSTWSAGADSFLTIGLSAVDH